MLSRLTAPDRTSGIDFRRSHCCQNFRQRERASNVIAASATQTHIHARPNRGHIAPVSFRLAHRIGAGHGILSAADARNTRPSHPHVRNDVPFRREFGRSESDAFATPYVHPGIAPGFPTQPVNPGSVEFVIRLSSMAVATKGRTILGRERWPGFARDLASGVQPPREARPKSGRV